MTLFLAFLLLLLYVMASPIVVVWLDDHTDFAAVCYDTNRNFVPTALIVALFWPIFAAIALFSLPHAREVIWWVDDILFARFDDDAFSDYDLS